MSSAREDWPRLASYVVSARVAAGHKDRRAFAAATGITERTLGNLERGVRVGPETLATVETALGWKPDSARRILDGGEPITAENSGLDSDDYRPRYADPALEYIWQTPGLPAEARRGLVALAIAWRQERNEANSRSA